VSAEIAILVPVLGRPQSAQPLIDSIRRATTMPHRIVFICSSEDRHQHHACRATGEETLLASWEPGPGDFARKTNLGFRETEEPFVFCGADDLRFHPDWATAALAVAEETGACVIGTDDLGNPLVRRGRHSTHSLVRRSYALDPGCTMDRTGEIYCELYDHQCVDNELVETAQARGVWAFARDAKVEHLHPLWRRTPMDETYRKALANGRADIRLLGSRRRLWTARSVLV